MASAAARGTTTPRRCAAPPAAARARIGRCRTRRSRRASGIYTDADFVGFRVVRPLRDPDAGEGEALRAGDRESIKDYKEAQAGKQ